MLFPKYGSNTKKSSNIFQLDSLFREKFVQLIILEKKKNLTHQLKHDESDEVTRSSC